MFCCASSNNDYSFLYPSLSEEEVTRLTSYPLDLNLAPEGRYQIGERAVAQCRAYMQLAQKKKQKTEIELQKIFDRALKERGGIAVMTWIELHPQAEKLKVFTACMEALDLPTKPSDFFSRFPSKCFRSLSSDQKKALLSKAIVHDPSFALHLVNSYGFSLTKEQAVPYAEIVRADRAKATMERLRSAIKEESSEKLLKCLADEKAMASLTSMDKAACIDLALIHGYLPLIDILMAHRFTLSFEQSREYALLQSTLERVGMQRHANEARGHSLPPRPLNARHAKHYASKDEENIEKTQALFEVDYRRSVDFARYYLSQKMDRTDGRRAAEQLTPLRRCLANRRGITAKCAATPGAHGFGSPRCIESVIGSWGTTKLKTLYPSYAQKILDKRLTNTQCRGRIGDYLVPLTAVALDAKGDNVLVHTSPDYFLLINAHIHQMIFDLFHISEPIEKIKQLGRIHWWLAHEMPYDRGSAAISEAFTHALWDECGLPPFQRIEGVSLDLEALVEFEEEVFASNYGAMRGLPPAYLCSATIKKSALDRSALTRLD